MCFKIWLWITFGISIFFKKIPQNAVPYMNPYVVLLLIVCLPIASIFSRINSSVNFIQCHDARLSQRSDDVPLNEISSDEIQEIIDIMFSVAKGERQDLSHRVMIGLAAPQIGICKRIILVDTSVDRDRLNLGNLKVYINPVIKKASETLEKGREGCYSVDSRLCGVVWRPDHITIQAYDRYGNTFSEELCGLTARIFQHECDHLDGLEFPDRMGEDDQLHWVEEADFPNYRKHWETWDKLCPREVWDAMKAGLPFETPAFQDL